MYTLLLPALGNLLFLALHVTGSGSFPRPLSAREEQECRAYRFSEVIEMYTLLLPALGNLLFLALHVTGSGSFPRPLSAREEQECLQKIREGDTAARNKLIEHNLRLVAHIIKKYYAVSGDQDDLISIGTIGLIKAVTTFDAEKGARFATYASRCIENEILMYFRARKKSAQDVYLYDPIDTDKDGNALTMVDIMADEHNILDEIDLSIQAEQLRELIATRLSRREQELIRLRYGLAGQRPHTQKEVAAQLGISRSYVSRIEKKAISKLKLGFREAGVSD